ncbi:MAG: helix-turn-helix domain-containing protein [Balneolaceae bacterium]|nr:helix-turn-helix domain-containing protein [Balneolaceae bacterium]MBO6545043.1 helix-turn-helix domain-containing protein [Balneolaceae bacterium]MBO6646439.1 helix-turn-helix domain-containing protein [Balneolaceae bacterium]
MTTRYPKIQIYHPSELLKPWVDSYIILQHRKDGIKDPLLWTIMPDCTGYLIFHLLTDRSRLSLVGPRSVFKNINRTNRVLTLIVKFKPWGLSGILPFPTSELKDTSIPLSQIFGYPAINLKYKLEELARSGDIRSCLKKVERFIEKHIVNKKSNPKIEYISQLVSSNQGLITVKRMADEMGFSDRYLRKIFSLEVGLSPKRYSMITRVTNIVKSVDTGSAKDWTNLALSSGYFDQSHMIDDFNNLLGESPEVFINRNNREEII